MIRIKNLLKISEDQNKRLSPCFGTKFEFTSTFDITVIIYLSQSIRGGVVKASVSVYQGHIKVAEGSHRTQHGFYTSDKLKNALKSALNKAGISLDDTSDISSIGNIGNLPENIVKAVQEYLRISVDTPFRCKNNSFEKWWLS